MHQFQVAYLPRWVSEEAPRYRTAAINRKPVSQEETFLLWRLHVAQRPPASLSALGSSSADALPPTQESPPPQVPYCTAQTCWDREKQENTPTPHFPSSFSFLCELAFVDF